MILEKKISSYKTRMILTISNLDKQDPGSYVCVSGKLVFGEYEENFRAVIFSIRKAFFLLPKYLLKENKKNIMLFFHRKSTGKQKPYD